MVLLIMTPSIVEGLKNVDSSQAEVTTTTETNNGDATSTTDGNEPSLEDPEVGKPISHDQIVDLWKRLQSTDSPSHSLEQLLRGAHVYVPPPSPKPEPSQEYKALMSRLRREEEARSYERMINPPPRLDTFQDRFPNAVHAFSEVNKPSNEEDIGDDEASYNEVHRQVTLIINFLVSIAGVAGTLWIAARWWSTPSRLFLTLGGSILVAIAEVVVYSGYMWRMEQGSKKENAVKEVKQVVETWVVGEDDKGAKEDEKTILLKSNEGGSRDTVRKRKMERKEET